MAVNVMNHLKLPLIGFVLWTTPVFGQLYEWGGGEVKPPPGTPICSDWYREQALPKLGCHPETIEKICSGALPKLEGYKATLPFCGGYEKASYDTTRYGMTCQTPGGQCSLSEPALFNTDCMCKVGLARYGNDNQWLRGWVTRP
jgi:hypothetical protein